MTSVIVYKLQDQFVESPLLKTLLLSALRTNCRRLIFGFSISLWSLRLLYTTFPKKKFTSFNWSHFY